MRGTARHLALAACLAVLLALPPALPGHAQGQGLDDIRQRIEDKKGQLNDANEKLQQIQQQLDQKRQWERATLQQLVRLERELDRTASELERVRGELAAAQGRLEAATRELAQAEKDLARRNDLLGRRVRALYEHGTVTYLDVLLAAQSFSDLITRYEYLRQIYTGDLALFRQVRQYRDYVATVKARQEAEKARVEVLLRETEGTKALLERNRAETEQVRRALHADIEELRRAYDEWERESQRIAGELQQLEKELAERLRRTGALLLERPLQGPITSPFGYRVHPILGQRRMHTGTDYAAPMGTPIRAAESGLVTHAGWLGGYGKAVIIMHGRGISTLYAHMSEIKVSEGATVSRGQVIGLVGSTGLSTGPHLHLEVRVNGEPQDPEQYLGRPIQ